MILASLLVGLALPSVAAEPLVVYVVRHAEKAAADTDPPLSDAGRARAEALARTLGEVPLVGVHSTDTARTRDTAAPVAQAHGLDVRRYDDLDALVASLRAAGGAHLVVGHSNTAPVIAAKLSDAELRPMSDAEYDRLLMVVVPERGPATAHTLRYGAP